MRYEVNIKLMAVLTGVVTIAFSATPFAVKAKTDTPTQPFLAQATIQSRQGQFANLNLTQEQTEQIRKLHEETRQKIEALLTPQQREQYKTTLENRRNPMRNGYGIPNSVLPSQGRQQNILATLNLSKQQKNQIRQIVQSSRTRLNTILTNEQRKQLQQFRDYQLRNRAQ
jgi:Spy/CpxP family protein refolding chaperone